MPQNFQRVEENIYRGGEPSIPDLKMLNDVYKLKRVISLDASAASRIAPTLKELKIEHIIVPINSSDTTMTDPLNQLTRNIVMWLTTKQPVYIHCLNGSDRTGLAIGLYRVIHDGWSATAALGEARHFGYGLNISLNTQNLYQKILTSFDHTAQPAPTTPSTTTSTTTDIQNAKDSDAVDEMREVFNGGNNPPATNPNISFAPFVSDPTYSRRLRRTQMWQDIADANDIPIVGESENVINMNGAGIVNQSGMFQVL